MRVAYVTIFDATDVRNWSGLDLHIWKSLQAAGLEIELVGNLRHGRSFRRKMRKLWGTRVERRSFLHLWDTDTARDYAEDVAERIQQTRVDAVLSPSPIPLAYLQCRQPRVLWTDATFAGLASFYPEFAPQNVSSATTRSGHEIDRRSLENCRLAIYSSDWAAETARTAVPACAGKVMVIPYGANVDVSHSAIDVHDLVRSRPELPLRLLFIGVDWHRKGGSHAVEVAAELNRRGIRTELTVVGGHPDMDLSRYSFVKPLGFLSKDTPVGQQRINELLATSHFLILPSRAECCAVVLAEASAFGLPIVASRVGGMGTVVRDDATGRLFDLRDPPSAWADWIASVLTDRTRYQALATRAFGEFQSRLNWQAAGRAAAAAIKECLQEERAA